MPTKVERKTVDLSGYPDLVVIYLGMRVNRMAGLKTLLGFGPKISKSVPEQPDGLLRHENFIFFAVPDAPGIQAVLAGHGFAAAVVAVRAASTRVARVSGTRHISGAAGWKRCTTIFRSC